MPRRIDVDHELEEVRQAKINTPDKQYVCMAKFKPVSYEKVLEAVLEHNARTGEDLAVSTFCQRTIMENLDNTSGFQLSSAERAGLQTLMTFWGCDSGQALRRLLTLMYSTDLSDVIMESEIASQAERAKLTQQYQQATKQASGS